MNTCRTCKHWDVAIGFDRQNRCAAEKVGESNTDDGLWNDAATPNYIYTGPDFGCVHHEEKP